jgi:chorismate mutase / prephenate dehydratase
MEDLNQLRNQIDEIDEKMVLLFEERMEAVMKIAAYKNQNGIPILNETREKEVIKKNTLRLRNKTFEHSLERFLVYMMSLSREEQSKIVGNSSQPQ